MSHPISAYAHAAFCSGFAARGGTVITDRVRSGHIAAIQLAIENWDDPNVIEATLNLGQLEGVWAKIYARREDLLTSTLADFSAAWKKAFTGGASGFPALVSAARHSAGLLEKTDPTTLVWTSSVVLHILQGMMTRSTWNQLRLEVGNAITSGQAYGVADAMELLAEKINASTFNFDRAYADVKTKFEADPSVLRQADQFLNMLMTDVANIVARHLSVMAKNGASEEDMHEWAQQQISTGHSPMFTLMWHVLILAAITFGIKWFYQSNGVAQMYFITAGDGDVCQDCEDAENGNPYPAYGAPSPPLHPNCRCSLVSYDDISGSVISAYLD